MARARDRIDTENRARVLKVKWLAGLRTERRSIHWVQQAEQSLANEAGVGLVVHATGATIMHAALEEQTCTNIALCGTAFHRNE